MQTIKVRHNCEMAHRLTETPGKCEQIHGHSWWVELEIGGDIDSAGILGGLEFGEVKKVFRGFLDGKFDHRLLLNVCDPVVDIRVDDDTLPGLQVMQGDPTTENFARIVGEEMRNHFGTKFQYRVVVWETSVNAATWEG